MVRRARDWPWSSYRKTAYERYIQFVQEGKGHSSPWESLKNQVYLGDEKFVKEMQRLIEPDKSLDEIPKNQKRKMARALEEYDKRANTRNEAIYL